MSKEKSKEKEELQILGQNLNTILIQKQSFQSQLLEIDNALKELEDAKDDCYKIVGNIMIKSDKSNLVKDLKAKKELVELRVKTVEKQEEKLQEKFHEKQKEVIKNLK
ncbi:MAG: prefoldin subunit beta [Candidatus Nanoarchaeia archaeon]|nr:prefoldin subunit beta [Candidatus Nanoarchaeia archaeon]